MGDGRELNANGYPDYLESNAYRGSYDACLVFFQGTVHGVGSGIDGLWKWRTPHFYWGFIDPLMVLRMRGYSLLWHYSDPAQRPAMPELSVAGGIGHLPELHSVWAANDGTVARVVVVPVCGICPDENGPANDQPWTVTEMAERLRTDLAGNEADVQSMNLEREFGGCSGD